MRKHRLCALWAVLASLVACTSLQSPTPALNSLYETAHFAFLVDSEDSQGGFSEYSLYVADLATAQTQLVTSGRDPSHSHSCPPVWSPDGEWIALGAWNGECSQSYEVVDWKQGKVWSVDGLGWGGIKGWTSDSHYVVFYTYGHDNVTGTVVYDVLEKKPLPLPAKTNDWFHPYHGPVAISPVLSTLLLHDGSLIDLPGSLSAVDVGYVDTGAWSPDGSRLAFMGCQLDDRSSCALYLAQGDGAHVQRIMDASPVHGPVVWAPDAQSVTFWSRSIRYVLDVQQLQAQVLPVDEEPSWPVRCGNTAYLFEKGILFDQEASTACWSPDELLLAVGGVDILGVYDKDFHLLHSFPINGAVGSIAWSPIP